MPDQFSFTESQNSTDYSAYLEKVRLAQQRISLGYDTLRAEHTAASMAEKLRQNRIMLGLDDRDSAFGKYETAGLAKGDMITSAALRTADIAFGAGTIATGFAPGIGGISGMLGKGAFYGTIAASAGGGAGIGGLAGTLGTLSGLTNPYYLAAIGALKFSEFGTQEGIIDPFVQKRKFSSTAFTSMRSTLGGMQSNLGAGGMDMAAAREVGDVAYGIRRANRDIDPSVIDTFLRESANMPQMQNVQNVEQAVENMTKFLEIGTLLAKRFKGKDPQAIVESLKTFGSMGMTLDQSKQAFEQTSQFGSILNVDPSRIMQVGGMGAQMTMGTGISQGTGYAMGTNNFIQAERMRQAGQYTMTQLTNFGGTEGISQMNTNAQMRFFESSGSDMFLKALYNRDQGSTGAGLDKDALQQMLSGNMGLGETRRLAAQITMNPEANMQFQYDKQALVSSLGSDANAVVYNALDKQFGNKNPFGTTLQGRAKWLQSYGYARNKQEAMLFAQNWMAYDPKVEAYNTRMQEEQMWTQFDPFYSSESRFGRGLHYLNRDLNRFWEQGVKRDTPFSVLSPTTESGITMRKDVGRFFSGLLGADDLYEDFRDITTTRTPKKYKLYDKLKDAEDFINVARDIREGDVTDLKNDIAGEDIGRLLSKTNIEGFKYQRDRDVVSRIKEDIRKGSVSEKYLFDQKEYGDWSTKYRDIFKGAKTSTDIKRIAYEQADKYIKENRPGGVDESYLGPGGQKTDLREIIASQFLKEELTPGQQQEFQIKNLSEGAPKLLQERIGERILPPTKGPITKRIIAGISNIWGPESEDKDYNLLAQKLNASNIRDQEKIINIIKTARSDQPLSEEQMALIGGDLTAEDLVKQRETDEVKALLNESKKPDFVNKRFAIQRQQSMITGVKRLYGGKEYREFSGELTGDENVMKSIMQRFMFGKDNVDDTGAFASVDREEYTKLINTLKGKPEGDILRKYTYWDDDSKTMQFNENISDRQRDKLMRNIYKGPSMELGVESAEDLWDKRAGQTAKTVQDFATAVAQGIRISQNENWGNEWNKITDTKEDPKNEGKAA